MPVFPGVGATFGRYDVLRLIGRGGMGVVYEARQRDLGRLVALKLLNPELADDPEFRGRFEREARMLAALDSPHVIQVYDAGELDGVLFLATQLVSGSDLSSYLEASGPATLDVGLAVMADVASALADAHEASILHRDIKPGNVLLRQSGSVFAYLCDFGIARPAQSTLTRTSQMAGTIAYLAPECHTGAEASVASDVYSLGCCLWATLAGQAPYVGQTDYQLAMAHLNDEVPQLGSTDARSRRVDEILRRSMAKRPEDRYRSAHEMEDALRSARAASGDQVPAAAATTVRPIAPHETQLRTPIAAPPATPAAAPAPMRHRWPMVVGAGVLALLVAGGVALGMAKAGGDPAGRPAALPTEAASGSASPSAGSTPATVPVTATRSGFLCGVKSARPSAQRCAEFRSALRDVFPTLDPSSCTSAVTNDKLEELAAVECEYTGVTVRYSRWFSDDDPRSGEGGPTSKYSYFKHSYHSQQTWYLGGRDAGDYWVDKSSTKDRYLPYVWAAAYKYLPYSVVVKAHSADTRDVWGARIQTTATPTREIQQP